MRRGPPSFACKGVMVGYRRTGRGTQRRRRASGGMADAGDLKSPVRKDVRVRIPPRPFPEVVPDRFGRGKGSGTFCLEGLMGAAYRRIPTSFLVVIALTPLLQRHQKKDMFRRAQKGNRTEFPTDQGAPSVERMPSTQGCIGLATPVSGLSARMIRPKGPQVWGKAGSSPSMHAARDIHQINAEAGVFFRPLGLTRQPPFGYECVYWSVLKGDRPRIKAGLAGVRNAGVRRVPITQRQLFSGPPVHGSTWGDCGVFRRAKRNGRCQTFARLSRDGGFSSGESPLHVMRRIGRPSC